MNVRLENYYGLDPHARPMLAKIDLQLIPSICYARISFR